MYHSDEDHGPVDLTLPEEMMLLVLDDVTGRVQASLPNYLAAGAALAALSLSGHLTPHGEGKHGRFQPTYMSPPSDPYLSEALDVMAGRGFDRKPRVLINAVAKRKHLVPMLKQNLIDKGILERKWRDKLLVFTETTYPTKNPVPEQMLKERLAKAMFGKGPVDPGDAVLVTLAKAGCALNRNFDAKVLKAHKARINEITKGANLAATSTQRAMEAVHAAMIAATVVPAVVATA